ncbi:MAG: hypothetical protein V7K68_16685 [Nostoc sp.]|uniref:hypothetical protein n=1 Tax=Nostoc sp. TaxID=1180 RepID=UPI002FF99A74
MKIQELITEGLSLPKDAIAYHVSQEIAAIYPKKVLLESSDSSFNLENYTRANLCTIQQYPDIHNPIITGWNGMYNNLYEYRENGCFEVTWQGNKFDVILMSWQQGSCKNRYYWILADSKELAKKFFAAVCEWNSEIRSEVLVFANGCWNKNSDFFKSIKKTNFEDIILHGNLKQEIQDDLINFFASEEAYANYNVPWKRGILLIGSPGNGKTKTIKALINLNATALLICKKFQRPIC